MQYNIAVIKGDGIGPEIVTEAMKAMEVVGEKFGHTFNFTECYAGGNAIDKYGIPLPQETLDVCKASDSVLLGAVGGPKWDSVPSDKRPERALLGLRSNLELFVNLRPAQMHAALADACPIKPEIIGDGFDILVCRELTGDVYFGKRGRRESELGETGWDDMNYSVTEVERIGRRAFDMAMKRNKKLTSVDKANVLASSRLWRQIAREIEPEYPDVKTDYMFVDNAAMRMIAEPTFFDVMVTENTFGDILTDEGSCISGSMGLLPSASTGESTPVFEPVHGSWPQAAGKNIANPLAQILSVAMMLEYFDLKEEGTLIRKAVDASLDANVRTPEIQVEGGAEYGTREVGAWIVDYIKNA